MRIVSSPLSECITTKVLPLLDCPAVRNRGSSGVECVSSTSVMDRRPLRTVEASSNETRCFFSFSATFPGSQSKFTPASTFVRLYPPWLGASLWSAIGLLYDSSAKTAFFHAEGTHQTRASWRGGAAARASAGAAESSRAHNGRPIAQAWALIRRATSSRYWRDTYAERE